jgi:hypothetical protein
MAKYTITRSCSHTEEVQIYGTNSHGERTRQAEYEATKLCRECYLAAQQAKRDAAAAEAAQTATEQGLPELTGSEKQIKWALSIRAEKLSELAATLAQVTVHNPTTDAMLATAQQRLTAHTASSWWIDNRNETARRLLQGEISADEMATAKASVAA